MRHRLSSTLAALALLAGCAATPWSVDSFEAPESDVAGKASFAWRAGEVGTPLVRRPELAQATEARMREVIVAELVRKGYVETSEAGAADMIVSFQAAGTRRFVESDQRRIGAPSPNELLTPGNMPPRPASELPPERSVREGTVVVFAEDPASGQLIWRGLVGAEIRAASAERTLDQIVEIGRHIAQEFPARRGSH